MFKFNEIVVIWFLKTKKFKLSDKKGGRKAKRKNVNADMRMTSVEGKQVDHL